MSALTMLKNIFFTLTFFFSISVFAHENPPVDSVGVEKKGNKTFILHKVTAGENLTKIAKRYRTSISEIVKENELAEPAVKIDQILRIPYNPPKNLAKTEPKKPEKTLTAEALTHTVAAGEGLYGISKKYKVSIADLKKWNNLESETLKEGQILSVSATPAKKPEIKEDKKEEPKKTEKITPKEEKLAEPKKDLEIEPQANANGQKIHIVKAGEGLFRISQTYKVSQENIRKWNNMDSDNLSLGQELILEEPKETIVKKEVEKLEIKPSETKTAEVKTEKKDEKKPDEKKVEEKKDEKSAKADEKKEPKITQKEEKPEKNPNNYLIKTDNGYPKFVETGMAEVIEDSQGNDLFLALHRTAPVGTIMQVRNLMNDLSVFVKVIGKLPDTGANDKLIVKISKRAYDRLGAIDKRFRSEVSYLPQ